MSALKAKVSAIAANLGSDTSQKSVAGGGHAKCEPMSRWAGRNERWKELLRSSFSTAHVTAHDIQQPTMSTADQPSSPLAACKPSALDVRGARSLVCTVSGGARKSPAGYAPCGAVWRSKVRFLKASLAVPSAVSFLPALESCGSDRPRALHSRLAYTQDWPTLGSQNGLNRPPPSCWPHRRRPQPPPEGGGRHRRQGRHRPRRCSGPT